MFIFINGYTYFQGGYYFVLKMLINNYYSIISMAHDCDSWMSEPVRYHPKIHPSCRHLLNNNLGQGRVIHLLAPDIK